MDVQESISWTYDTQGHKIIDMIKLDPNISEYIINKPFRPDYNDTSVEDKPIKFKYDPYHHLWKALDNTASYGIYCKIDPSYQYPINVGTQYFVIGKTWLILLYSSSYKLYYLQAVNSDFKCVHRYPLNHINQKSYSIGSNSKSNFIIETDTTISSSHVRLEADIEKGMFTIRDCESTNGTFIQINEMELKNSNYIFRIGLETFMTYSREPIPFKDYSQDSNTNCTTDKDNHTHNN